MFSIPLNPKLPQKDFEAFVQFLTDYKDWIYDFYFTCRIPPFTQDAMGDVFTNGEEDHNFIIEMALWIQQQTGVTASAVFNNLEVRPSQENLDLFIEEFTPVYDAGIVSATIPHTPLDGNQADPDEVSESIREEHDLAERVGASRD